MIKYKGISTLEVLEEAKNYNEWIADSIAEYLTAPSLEVGAGIGNLTKLFLEHKPLYITDVDKGLVKALNKKFSNEKDIFIDELDITKEPHKKYISFFASVFAVNVLEHIGDDLLALKNIHSILKKEGRLVLLVPAKRFAYTKLDRDLGHARRYEKDELENKLKKSGYTIEKNYFFNIVGLLSWTIRDKVNRNNVHLKPYHIKIFDLIVPMLRWIESKVKMPIGISLIVIARKR